MKTTASVVMLAAMAAAICAAGSPPSPDRPVRHRWVDPAGASCRAPAGPPPAVAPERSIRVPGNDVGVSPTGDIMAYWTLDQGAPVLELARVADGKPLATVKSSGGDVEPPHIAASPLGLVATVSFRRNVTLWDWRAGREYAQYFLPDFQATTVRRVDLSPDGALVAAALSNGIVAVWDRLTQEEFRWLTPNVGEATPVTSLAFSPDSARVAAGRRFGIITIWNVRTGKVTSEWSEGQCTVHDIAWSPDGSHVSTVSSDGNVRKWHVATRALAWSAGDHTSPVTTVAVSPDGRLVASGACDGLVIVRSAVNGAIKGTLSTDIQVVRSVLFSTDGSHVIAVGPRQVDLWPTPK